MLLKETGLEEPRKQIYPAWSAPGTGTGDRQEPESIVRVLA